MAVVLLAAAAMAFLAALQQQQGLVQAGLGVRRAGWRQQQQPCSSSLT
jgi:hypothetical protein